MSDRERRRSRHRSRSRDRHHSRYRERTPEGQLRREMSALLARLRALEERETVGSVNQFTPPPQQTSSVRESLPPPPPTYGPELPPAWRQAPEPATTTPTIARAVYARSASSELLPSGVPPARDLRREVFSQMRYLWPQIIVQWRNNLLMQFGR